MKKIKYFGFYVLLLFLICYTSCIGSGSSRLIGKWETIENQNFWVETIEFFKDGSALVNSEGTSWQATENGYIKIPGLEGFGMGKDGFKYSISDSILTITYWNNIDYKLRKVK